MANPVVESANYKTLSASGQVAPNRGHLIGIFVASGSPTIKVWDSLTATGNVIVNTFQTAGVGFYPIPAEFRTGLYVTITGTAEITVFAC
jgi:hypothetical protein